jgi:hypothetical protein
MHMLQNKYDRNMDVHVASLAYLLKLLQDMIKELYVDSTLNITNHLIIFVVLVK